MPPAELLCNSDPFSDARFLPDGCSLEESLQDAANARALGAFGVPLIRISVHHSEMKYEIADV